MAGAVRFGELADLDEALAYCTGGRLFAGWGCGEGVEVSVVLVWLRKREKERRRGMGKGKGGGTPCSGDPFGVDCEFGVGFEDLEEELWGWLAWGLSRKAGVGI